MLLSAVRRWLAACRKIAPERFVLLVLALLAVLVWGYVIGTRPRPLEVVAFAVGDGDSFLIRAPSGRAVLIDGGSRTFGNIGKQVLVPNLHLYGVRRLDAVIVTHPDTDHVNALDEVLAAVPVGLLLESGTTSDTPEYQQFCTQAQRRHVPRRLVRAGDRLQLGGGVTLHMLAPGHTLLHGTNSDTNSNSVVCLLTYGKSRLLFTGDLEGEGEAGLLARGGDLQADILCVAHHGSRYGTSPALLDAVHPTQAIISARGSTAAGHPHPETLARLQRRGIIIWRTDIHGQLRLTTTGAEWSVEPYK